MIVNQNQFCKPSDYFAMIMAKHEEICKQPYEGQEAVLAAIDLFLNSFKPPLFTTHIERSLGVEQ